MLFGRCCVCVAHIRFLTFSFSVISVFFGLFQFYLIFFSPLLFFLICNVPFWISCVIFVSICVCFESFTSSLVMFCVFFLPSSSWWLLLSKGFKQVLFFVSWFYYMFFFQTLYNFLASSREKKLKDKKSGDISLTSLIFSARICTKLDFLTE